MEVQHKLSPSEMQAAFLGVCNGHQWPPAFLNTPVNSPQQLAKLCMKELVACRAVGKNELAVALGNAALAAGLHQPRLAVQRKRALSQLQGEARSRNDSSALSTQVRQQRLGGNFWSWLPFVGSKNSPKRNTLTVVGTPEQVEALVAICRSADWSPRALHSETASRNLPRALLLEMRACAEVGKHQLVVRLGRKAAAIGIQDPRLQRARRQAQGLLNSALQSQIETAIQLRQQGHAAASLTLLDYAHCAGCRSPWLLDNRARALVDLGRRSEAISAWEDLQSNDDAAVVDAAMQMLELERKQLLIPLNETLHQLAAQYAWPLHHLGDPASLDLQSYLKSLLQDAIEARDNNHPELSLALLEAALDSGLTSPWLHDNRARALVHLNRLPEAVAIWQQLCIHNDDTVRNTAQDLVGQFSMQAQQQELLAEVGRLRQAFDGDQGMSMLTDALINEPDCLEILNKFDKLLTRKRGEVNSSDGDSSQGQQSSQMCSLSFSEVLDTLEHHSHDDKDQS